MNEWDSTNFSIQNLVSDKNDFFNFMEHHQLFLPESKNIIL